MKKIIKLMLDKSIKYFLLVFCFLQTTISFSHAYIDPGTGSFIIQTIMALAATIVVYLGYPIRIIKSFFNKFFNSKKKTDKDK